MSTIRWGILGTGAIATKFATGLQALPDAELVAVGSRSTEGAERFGATFDIPRRYASYDALVADANIDAVYIATPHPSHKPDTLRCIAAGKAVLCEKPFAMNATEAEAMVAAARSRGVFLMEAMWTRFLPAMDRFRQLIDAGVIGEPRLLQADFGFQHSGGPEHRLFNLALGGGSLLDVGVYLVSLASWIFGPPERVTGYAHLGASNIDEQAALLLGCSGGAFAQLTTAIRVSTPHEATIMGTEGRIRVHTPWWAATKLTITRPGQPDEELDLPFTGNGYSHEAAEVGRCLREGRTESPTMPLDETIAILRTLDLIRLEWGLRYPGE